MVVKKKQPKDKVRNVKFIIAVKIQQKNGKQKNKIYSYFKIISK